MTRRVLIWVIAAVAVLGAATAVVVFTLSGEPSADASQPDRDTAERTLSFLDSEGAKLLTMHRAAQELTGGTSAERCDRVGETLDREAPPDQIDLLMSKVADEPLRAGLAEERDSLGATLAACRTDGTSDRPPPPLNDVTGKVQARLDALEAAR